MFKFHPRVLIALCVGVLAGLVVGGASIATGDKDDAAFKARAKIMNPAGKQIGEATFRQRSATNGQPTPLVDVSVRVKGLPPSAGPNPNERGFHVHDTRSCEAPGFRSAGGHFDTGPAKNSEPVDFNHPYHLGDLPNLRRDNDGVFRMRTTTSRFTIQPGHPTTLFDGDSAAVIVHQRQDVGNRQAPGQPGVPESGTAGGARDACGLVEMQRPDDD